MENDNNIDKPWAEYNAQNHEWLFSEDSYERSIIRRQPVHIYKYCQYDSIEKDWPIWSIEDARKPAGYQDLAVFASPEGLTYKISKRIVDLHGEGRWHVGGFFTLHVRGCCNIVGIIEE